LPRASFSESPVISNTVKPRTVKPLLSDESRGKIVGAGNNAPYSKIIAPEAANKDKIDDSNNLLIGTVLVIP